MTTFEVGKKYYDTSACAPAPNRDFPVEIVQRTAQPVTFRRNGKERRAKIYTDPNGEFIIPDRYSMAPVFRACRELVEETPAEEAPTGSNIIPFPVAV